MKQILLRYSADISVIIGDTLVFSIFFIFIGYIIYHLGVI